jgi:hypothetical protein
MPFTIIIPGLRPLLISVAVVLAAAIAGFLIKLYRIRCRLLSLEKQGYVSK